MPVRSAAWQTARSSRLRRRTADAFTLFERLEAKLDQHPGQLTRACVELAKDWRTDRYLRRLEAMMAVADKDTRWCLTAPATCLNPRTA